MKRTPSETTAVPFGPDGDDRKPLFTVCPGVSVERASDFADTAFRAVHAVIVESIAGDEIRGDLAFVCAKLLEMGIAANAAAMGGER